MLLVTCPLIRNIVVFRLGKYGPDNPAEHPGYSDPTGLVDDHFQCATEMATEWRATDIFRPRDGLAMAPHFSVRITIRMNSGSDEG